MPERILSLPSWFGDHMVLQQQVRTRVYGKTKAQAPVRLSLERFPSGELLSGGDTEYGLVFQEEDIAEEDGFFEFKLPMIEASFDSFRLTLESCGERRIFQDLLFGEVWLALGGSNMSMPLTETDLRGEIPALSQHKSIRFFTQTDSGLAAGQTLYSPDPLGRAPGGHWLEPGRSRDFSQMSALASGFALGLSRELRLPVGIFNLACPDSCLHSWLPGAVVEQDAILKNHVRELKHYRDREHWNELPAEEKKEERVIRKSLLNRDLAAQDPPFSRSNQPGALFNHKLAPYTGLPARGVLWYQGEEDCQYPDYYQRAFYALTQVFKEMFQSPLTGLYLIYSQLSPFMASDHDFMRLAVFNEALAAMRRQLCLPSAMVTNYDLPLDCPSEHPLYRNPKTPRAKAVLAQRMKDLALGLAYKYDLPASAPEVISAETVGNKLLLNFENAGKGIRLRGGESQLKGFSVCGEDGRYLLAEAKELYNVRVIVWHREIKNPRSCSYAFYTFNHEANLCASSGMPLVPFRLERECLEYEKPRSWTYCEDLKAYRWPVQDPKNPRAMGKNEPAHFRLWTFVEGRGRFELEHDNKRGGSASLKLSYSKADERPLKFGPILDYASDYPPLDLHFWSELNVHLFNTEHRRKSIRLYLADSNGRETMSEQIGIRDELSWQKISFRLKNAPVDLQRLSRLLFVLQDPEADGSLYLDDIEFSGYEA